MGPAYAWAPPSPSLAAPCFALRKIGAWSDEQNSRCICAFLLRCSSIIIIYFGRRIVPLNELNPQVSG